MEMLGVFLEGDIKIINMLAGANYFGAGGGFLFWFLEIERSNPGCWIKCPDYWDL